MRFIYEETARPWTAHGPRWGKPSTRGIRFDHPMKPSTARDGQDPPEHANQVESITLAKLRFTMDQTRQLTTVTFTRRTWNVIPSWTSAIRRLPRSNQNHCAAAGRHHHHGCRTTQQRHRDLRRHPCAVGILLTGDWSIIRSDPENWKLNGEKLHHHHH